VPKLCWRLRHDPAEDVREWSAYCLGRHRVEYAIPSLTRALEDPVQDVVSVAARALGAIGGVRAVRPLCQRIKRGDCNLLAERHILTAIAESAGQTRTSREAAEIMTGVLKDGRHPAYLREMAAAVVARSRGPSATVSGRGLGQFSLIDVIEIPRPDRLQEDEQRVLRSSGWRYAIKRDSVLKERVKRQREWLCQVCGAQPFVDRDGRKYAEAHHIRPLFQGGADKEENLLVICANCHRKLHYAHVEYEWSGDGIPLRLTINEEPFDIRWP
jgi:hypothetical protein